MNENLNDAAAYIKRGEAAFSRGDFDGAIADFNEAISRSPNEAKAYYNRGVARCSKKEYDRAVMDFTWAIRLNPNLAAAYYTRAGVYKRQGRTDLALADFETAVKLAPTNPKFQDGLAKAKAENPGASRTMENTAPIIPDVADFGGGVKQERFAKMENLSRFTENTTSFNTGGDFSGGFERETKFDRLTQGHPFFTFSKPYLDFIGKGTLFSLIYIVMAGISLLLPFAVFYMSIDLGIFRAGAKYVVAFFFAWLIIAFACWVGFQLWLDRRKKIAAATDASQFAVTLIFADIVQTAGEWLGTMIASFGAIAIVALLFLGESVSQFNYYLPSFIRFIGIGPLTVLIGPVIGFFVVIIFRCLAEGLRLLASLVNNTKEIAVNIKENRKGT